VVELQRKLKQRGYAPAEIKQLLSKLQQQHLVDDAGLAERYVRSALLTRSVGPRWLKAKLQQKGIDQTIIGQTLAEQYTPDEQQRLLQQAISTWQRHHTGPKATRDRLARFLLSRGFNPADVQQQLSDLA
jgi:regulatory protein